MFVFYPLYTTMRVVNFLLAVMFLIFAFVQINDPDPLIWIAIYGAMAVFSVMAIFDFFPVRVIWVALVILVGYSFVYLDGVRAWMATENKSALFDDVAKMEHWYIEEAREFLGLLICVVVLAAYVVRARRKRA